jgi:peptidoglycan/xylan/chitin deacetylase (PgdA/CDA1 family)
MDNHIPILVYHSIADDGPRELAKFRTSTATFSKQMRLLREWGYRSISLEEWAHRIATRRYIAGKAVIITFDDGYRDFLANAWPVLKLENFRATIFAVASKVGGFADWSGHSQQTPLMDWEELRGVQAEGNVVASHCNAHRDLTRLSSDAIAVDCMAARAAFRQELQKEALVLAYPWGKSDAKTWHAVAAGGYLAAVGISPRLSGFSDNLFDLPRIEIFGDDDLDTFARKLRQSAADPPQVEIFRGAEGAGSECLTTAVLPRPDIVRTLIGRMDKLAAEFLSIRKALADVSERPYPLETTLRLLFGQATGDDRPTALVPLQSIGPWVRVGFEGGAQVVFRKKRRIVSEGVEPFEAPANLQLAFTGSSRWFALDIALCHAEFSSAKRFQFGLSLDVDRDVECRAVLRLWQKDGQYREVVLVSFLADPTERHYNFSGPIEMPPWLDIDYESDPMFLLLFNSHSDVELEIHNLNLYFV